MQQSKVKPGRVLLLLHGLSGDENSMWIFTRKLPQEYTLLALRGLYAFQEKGYSWREMADGNWGFPSMSDLQPAADSLLAFVDAWSVSMSLPAKTLDIMGFSQGAALTLALALFHPDRVRALAVLSGFLPLGAEPFLEKHLLTQTPVFVAHGRQDDQIPVERARMAVKALQDSGARVTYCEADTGHKVSADCIQGLESYFVSIL